MGLRGRLSAAARGEVSTRALEMYGTANHDAYDLLERLPPEGPARLAAWCAFVLQTHADNLIHSGSAAGFCDREAFEDATTLYRLAAGWLDRARAGQASTDYVLDTVVPQPYVKPRGPQGEGQVKALRLTLWTVQSRLGADLAARSAEPVYARLAPTLASLQSALDTGAGLPASKPSPELLATIGSTLLGALDRAYQGGQLLAMTELLASRPEPPRAPATAAAATLTMFLPGDPGFDRWCLTDPLERMERESSGEGFAIRKLDEFWASDPEPAKTLALQAEIAAAVENGLADYVPQSGGSLAKIARSSPWPGVLLVKGRFVVDGHELAPGDRFVLSVGAGPDGFRRTVAVMPAQPMAAVTDEDAQRAEDERWARKHGFG